MKRFLISFVLTTICTISFAQVDLNSGLVAHYPFSGNANDESGNELHAESVNATLTTDRYGNENKAYFFDGNENVIDFGNILNDVFLTNTFTISVWFNAQNYVNGNERPGMLVAKWNSVNLPENSFILYGNYLRFITGGKNTDIPDFDVPEVGTWNMLTVSVDNGVASIYLNAELQGVVSDHSCNTSTYSLLVGNHHNPVYGFHGSIDDVRIYERPLSGEEVNCLYNVNLNEGLVAYYPLNGHANNEAIDDFHGTMQNNPALTNNRIGIEEQALNFDGTDQHISFDPENPIISSPTFTISAWARMDGVGGGSSNQNPIFVQRAYNTGQTSAISLHADNNSGNIAFAVRGHGTDADVVDAPGFEYGFWHHYLGVVSADSVKLFVDGQLVNAIELSTGTNYTEFINNVDIGKHRYSGVDHGLFNGDIDEVRIYNRPLNNQEVQALYYETLRAEFVADKHDGFAPLSVSFNDLSFADVDITTWQWDFDNDGVIDSEEQNPEFTFNTGGEYNVKLVVGDGTHTDSIIMNNPITVYDLNNGLTRHYKFDGDALDSSENEEHGEAYGAEVTDRYGIPESAYAFNGENNVTVPSIANWGEQLTISFWFYVEETSGNQVLIGSRAGSSGATKINLRSFLKDDGTVTFQVASDNSSNTDVTSSNTAEMFAWNHVVCELDLVNSTETITLNGVETSKSYTFTPRYLDDNIGFGNWKEPFASTSGLVGKIDEIRFYDRILLQEEKDIISTNDFPMTSYFGALAFYPFSGDAADVTGNGNDGDVNNAALSLDRYRNTDNAYEFTSDESHIDIGSGVKPESFPIYITAWVNPSLTEGENTIAATDVWEADGVLSGTIVQIIDGQIFAAFGAWDGGETSTFRAKTTTDVNVPVDQWTHIAAGFHSADDIRIYVNGELAEGTYEGDATEMLHTDYGNGMIGNIQDLSAPFSGSIDEVQILNRYLYLWEIAEMVNQPGMSASQSQIDFYNVPVGEESVEQVFSVYGFKLTDDISIQAPEGFSISLTTGSGFVQSLTLAPEEGLVDVTPIFIRFTPDLEETYNGEVVVSSEGVSNIIIAVSGSTPTNIEEEKVPDLNVYPNPFSNNIYIDNANSISRVTLVNMVGQVISDINTNGEQSLTIPTARLTKGVYLIIVQKANGEREVRRLVKE